MRAASHGRHRFPGQHELTEIDGYPFHPRDEYMISAPRIEDQELAVTAERSCIYHPSVARRGDLGAGPGRDGKALFRCLRRCPELPNSRTRTPLAGNGSKPRAEAKAMAGPIRPGSCRMASSRGGTPRPASPRRPVVAVRAARAALSRLRSVRAIKSLRLSTWRASAAARWRSPSSAFSTSACFSAALLPGGLRAGVPPSSAARSRRCRSRSSAMSRRRRTSSPRSTTNPSASPRISGSTAPSIMAVRTDSRASSGRTISAGGGRRPIRCSAASTSAMTPCRPSSERRIAPSSWSSRSRRAFGRRQPALHGPQARSRFDQGRVELAAIFAQRFDLKPQLALRFGRLALFQRGRRRAPGRVA